MEASEEAAVPLFAFTEGEKAVLCFLVASGLSRALCARVSALGDVDFLDVLACPPAEEETHLYLEVLEETTAALSFRGNFLVDVFLLAANEGELLLTEPEVGGTLPGGEDAE